MAHRFYASSSARLCCAIGAFAASVVLGLWGAVPARANMAAPLQSGGVVAAPAGWPAKARCRDVRWVLDLRHLGSPQGSEWASVSMRYEVDAPTVPLVALAARYGAAQAEVDGAPLAPQAEATETVAAASDEPLPGGALAGAEGALRATLPRPQAAQALRLELPGGAAERTLRLRLPLDAYRWRSEVPRPGFGVPLRWRPAQPCAGAESGHLRVVLPVGWQPSGALPLQETGTEADGSVVWEVPLAATLPALVWVTATGPAVADWLADLPLAGGGLSCLLLLLMGRRLGARLRRRDSSVGVAVAAAAVLGGLAGLAAAAGVAGGAGLAQSLAGPPLSAEWFPNSYGAIFAMVAAAPLGALALWMGALFGWRQVRHETGDRSPNR